MTVATGTFEVKATPLAADPDTGDLQRLSLNKQFHGDLEGASRGQMLAASTAVQGSAGYVAIERVTGTLNGRTGTFVMHHKGTMTRGTPEMSITVVPDSGTGELTGIAGTFVIEIKEGKHFYQFEYTLATS